MPDQGAEPGHDGRLVAAEEEADGVVGDGVSDRGVLARPPVGDLPAEDLSQLARPLGGDVGFSALDALPELFGRLEGGEGVVGAPRAFGGLEEDRVARGEVFQLDEAGRGEELVVVGGGDRVAVRGDELEDGGVLAGAEDGDGVAERGSGTHAAGDGWAARDGGVGGAGGDQLADRRDAVVGDDADLHDLAVELVHRQEAAVGGEAGRADYAGVGRLVGAEVGDGVESVRFVNEKAAGFPGAPGAEDHPVPDGAGVEGADDLVGLGVLEAVLGAVLDGIHELGRDGDGDVEIGHLREVFLAGDEVHDVGVVDAQDPHVGAAPGAALFHRVGGCVVELHERHGPGGDAGGGADHRALGAESREGEAGPAAGLVDERHRLEGVVDPVAPVGEGVLDGEDEARRELAEGAAGIH